MKYTAESICKMSITEMRNHILDNPHQFPEYEGMSESELTCKIAYDYNELVNLPYNRRKFTDYRIVREILALVVVYICLYFGHLIVITLL